MLLFPDRSEFRRFLHGELRDDEKIDVKPWIDETKSLLSKLPSGLESLMLSSCFKITADCMQIISQSCPNLTRLGIGNVSPYPSYAIKLDFQPIVDRLTHLSLWNSGNFDFFWSAFDGTLDGPFLKLTNFSIQMLSSCPTPSQFIVKLPKLFPNLETFHLGCYGNWDNDRTAANEWCESLRRMQKLRRLCIGPEIFEFSQSAGIRAAKWQSGDPLALTDDRLSKLQLSPCLEILSMPYSRGKCTKYALMSLLSKYPNLQMFYYPVTFDMKDTLFFNHYVLAWLEHEKFRKSLTIFVDDIEEVFPNDLEKFRAELRSDLRMEFRNFYQQETFCHCKTLKLAQTVRVWKIDEPEKWLCITNACPEKKESYFCSRCSDEDD